MNSFSSGLPLYFILLTAFTLICIVFYQFQISTLFGLHQQHITCPTEIPDLGKELNHLSNPGIVYQYDSGVEKVLTRSYYQSQFYPEYRESLPLHRARVTYVLKSPTGKIQEVWVEDGYHTLRVKPPPLKIEVQSGNWVQLEVKQIIKNYRFPLIEVTEFEVLPAPKQEIIILPSHQLSSQVALMPSPALQWQPALLWSQRDELGKYKRYIKTVWGNLLVSEIPLDRQILKKWKPGSCATLILPGFATSENWQGLLKAGFADWKLSAQ